MSGAPPSWTEANRAWLSAAVALALTRAARPTSPEEREVADAARLAAQLHEATRRAALDSPPALELLAQVLGLDPVSRDLILLAAAPELEARPPWTVAQALGALPEAHWSALLPTAPLRRWRLLDWNPALGPAAQPLRLDERIFYFLLGLPTLDPRLLPWLQPPGVDVALTPRQAHLAVALEQVWRARLGGEAGRGATPLPLLVGEDPGALRSLATLSTSRLGLRPRLLRASELPEGAEERFELGVLVEREALLSGLTLLFEVEEGGAEGLRRALHLAEGMACLVAVLGRDLPPVGGVHTVRLELPAPTTAERRVVWEQALGADLPRLGQGLDRVMNHFPLGPQDVLTACASARLISPQGPLDGALWEVCRSLGRPRLALLAQHIRSTATLEDVVLPPPQRQVLKDLTSHVRRRLHVLEGWGFGQRTGRGRGVSALFTGPSGTGKTFAAEALASALGLDLYRVDLSQVVNKYIGETEKNLRRIFESAEGTGAILLFDEADALFGKRTEVKDSHDRYANIEVDYLLQKMEAYSGLAVLTTNLKGSIDPAFLRRLSFVVPFPFPEQALRVELWRRAFPPGAPIEGLDYDRLARLAVAGGNIHNIALHAAYLASGEGTPIRMGHLGAAARVELMKLERAFSEAELAGWV